MSAGQPEGLRKHSPGFSLGASVFRARRSEGPQEEIIRIWLVRQTTRPSVTDLGQDKGAILLDVTASYAHSGRSPKWGDSPGLKPRAESLNRFAVNSTDSQAEAWAVFHRPFGPLPKTTAFPTCRKIAFLLKKDDRTGAFWNMQLSDSARNQPC
jgi:hypothetical protein